MFACMGHGLARDMRSMEERDEISLQADRHASPLR